MGIINYYPLELRFILIIIYILGILSRSILEYLII
jgi:hypothetical protein